MHWLLFIGIQVLRLSSAQTDATGGQCFDKIRDPAAACKQYDLVCGPSEIIIAVNVTSGTGSCKHPGCYGYTPDLLADTHNCVWKNNCTIEFPSGLIIKPIAGSCWDFSTFLQINDYSCLKLAENRMAYIDICGGEHSGGTYNGGLLYSHAKYPWMYHFNQSSMPCVKTFWYQSDKRLSKMVVSVLDLDLAETDSLRVMTSHENRTLLGGASMWFEKNSNTGDNSVKFAFTVSPYTVKGGGFVICFILVDRIGDNDNACELLGMTVRSEVQVHAKEPEVDAFSFFQYRYATDCATMSTAAAGTTSTTTTTTAAPTTTPTTVETTTRKCRGKRKKCRRQQGRRRKGSKGPKNNRKGKKRRNKKRNKRKRKDKDKLK